MQVIPLFKETTEPRSRIKNLEVTIPSEWWNVSYSLDFNVKKEPKVYPIYRYKKKEKVAFTHNSKDWNIKRGDYRVKESMIKNTRDYVYYRDLKIKLLKYSIYPVIFFTMLLILKLSEIISRL